MREMPGQEQCFGKLCLAAVGRTGWRKERWWAGRLFIAQWVHELEVDRKPLPFLLRIPGAMGTGPQTQRLMAPHGSFALKNKPTPKLGAHQVRRAHMEEQSLVEAAAEERGRL